MALSATNPQSDKPFHPTLPFSPNADISQFEIIADEIGKLVTEKNKAYGDSFAKSGDIIRILYPNGIRPDQYADALGIIRVLDKMFRIATDNDAFGETPWKDIAGYGVLGTARKTNPSQED